jgi:hypothetical protein
MAMAKTPSLKASMRDVPSEAFLGVVNGMVCFL